MSIFEKIKAELSKEYEKSNQEKLAQKGKVSQVTIGRYLANIENIKAMRLDTFFPCFPTLI
jgi:response regulator of citrate/malate metabolism